MGMNSGAISGVEKVAGGDKPRVNRTQFAEGFDNFINKLRSGQPVIGNLLNGQNQAPVSDQNAIKLL